MDNVSAAERVVQKVTVEIADLINERYLDDKRAAACDIAAKLTRMHPLPDGWNWIVEPDMNKPGHYLPKAVNAKGHQMPVAISITVHDINSMG